MTRNRIRELRDNKKMTLDDLSKATGIKRGTLNNYELGKTEPKLETWKKLADYFGTTLDYLVGFETIEQRNCPYCHVDHDIELEWNYKLEVGKCLPYDGYGYPGVYVAPFDHQINIDALDTPTLDINYCPMCGRKLDN
ncbi:helix-turn-helix domain-containing protein [Lentilactobacillus senioris]|uniref:helix-turn-helix domain-containing protein n=1 Tax=Lentilactobacillus senioris TaxID=931534 RepID=UPI003D2941FF